MIYNNIVLRKENGEDGFYLFRTKKQELLCREIIKGELREMAEVLSDITATDFDAIIDRNDAIHIISGDAEGSIFYLRRLNDKWERKCLLKAIDGSAAKTGDFHIFSHESGFSVIYIVQHKNDMVLCHQRIGKKIERPLAIAKIDPNASDIFAFQDEEKNILVVYTDGKTGELGQRKCKWDQKNWSDFEVIDGDERNCRNIFAINGRKKIHMCYKKRDNIVFRNIEKQNIVSEAQYLTRKHSSDCSLPILRWEGDSLKLMWGKGTKIFSAEKTKEWSRIEEKTIKNAKSIDVFKICDSHSGKVWHDLIYIAGKKIYMADSETDCLKKRKEAFENSGRKNYEYREKLENEKKRIAKQLGIEKSDNNLYERKNERTIIKEHKKSQKKPDVEKINDILKDLAKDLEKLRRIIEEIE